MFDTVVFPGGGNRCFWQAGFWEVVSRELQIRPRRILAVSGGAYVACGLAGGVLPGLVESSANAFAANTRNFYMWRLVSGRRPFPHPAIYRRTLEENIDAAALARIKASTAIHVKTSRPPRAPPLWLSLGAATLAYCTEKYVWRRLHPTLGARLGFDAVWRSTHDCARPGALIDLIVASSSVPPIFPVVRINGDVALDGGFIDSNPLDFPLSSGQSLGRTLVLLTRRYTALPDTPYRQYVQPSRPVPVRNFDATAAEGVRLAFALGQEDGARFARAARGVVTP